MRCIMRWRLACTSRCDIQHHCVADTSPHQPAEQQVVQACWPPELAFLSTSARALRAMALWIDSRCTRAPHSRSMPDAMSARKQSSLMLRHVHRTTFDLQLTYHIQLQVWGSPSAGYFSPVRQKLRNAKHVQPRFYSTTILQRTSITAG
jgi:hypothetical protein